MQYRIIHLLTLITLIAVTLALFRWHVVAGISAPLLIGPSAGLLAMQSRSGALIGLLSAIYWSIVTFLAAAIISIAAASIIDWEISPVTVAIFVYGLMAISSLIGGYVGSRVAVAGVVVRP